MKLINFLFCNACHNILNFIPFAVKFSCPLDISLILWWRKKHVGSKVRHTWREVGQRNPEQLGIPACTVTRAWEASCQRVLHTPCHLGDIWTAQEAHGEVLSFHIWQRKTKRRSHSSFSLDTIYGWISSTWLPLTVVKVRLSIGVFDVLREAGPQPPQVSLNKIQPGNSCLEEAGLDNAHFDAKEMHVPPGQSKTMCLLCAAGAAF